MLTSARFSISHLFRIFMAKTLSVFLTFTTATCKKDRRVGRLKNCLSHLCEAKASERMWSMLKTQTKRKIPNRFNISPLKQQEKEQMQELHNEKMCSDASDPQTITNDEYTLQNNNDHYNFSHTLVVTTIKGREGNYLSMQGGGYIEKYMLHHQTRWKEEEENGWIEEDRRMGGRRSWGKEKARMERRRESGVESRRGRDEQGQEVTTDIKVLTNRCTPPACAHTHSWTQLDA